MKVRIRFTAYCYILFSDAAYGVANPFNIPAKDTSIQLSSSETAHSMLEGNAAQGDDGDFLAYEASGVGVRLDPAGLEAAATVPAVRVRENVSLIHEAARPAVVKVSWWRFNTFGGRVDGMKLALWGCIAVLISVLAVSAIFLSMQYQQHSRLRDTASWPSADHTMVAPRSRRGASHGGPGSVGSFGLSPSVQRSTAKSCATMTSDTVSSSEQISMSSAYQTSASTAAASTWRH